MGVAATGSRLVMVRTQYSGGPGLAGGSEMFAQFISYLGESGNASLEVRRK